MASVLFLFSPQRDPETAAREAIEAAAERRVPLVVVAAIDPEALARVASTLSSVGFMGEKVSDRVSEALTAEYRARAAALVNEIVREAGERGVVAEGRVEDGDPSELCGRLAREHGASLVILMAERRSWLTRLLSRAPLRVPTLPNCEIRVVED